MIWLSASSDYTRLLCFVLIALNACLCAALITASQQRKLLASRLLGLVKRVGMGDLSPDLANPAIVNAPELSDALREMNLDVQQRVEELREAAQRDGLTGLSNRVHFQQRVERIIAAAGSDFRCTLFFMDLDGFKSVNDTLGHNVGDRLLQIAADRLRIATRTASRSEDDDKPSSAGSGDALLARFGGDEFVYYLGHPDSEAIAPKIASRILRVLSEPFEIGTHTVNVSASIGIAFLPQNAHDLNALLHAADAAMYHAKRSGRGRYEVYDPFLEDEAQQLAEQEQEVREAVVRGSFELFYQPLYDLRTMRLSSAEALIRWRHPRKGLLLPQQFLHLAERANLMDQIGEWVIGEAIKRIAEFERIGKPIQISINISPRHLERVDFIPAVKSALSRWKVHPRLLQIEVTEEAAIRDPELAADRLRQLSDLGVSIAIDDFGTGYSNLASLITLPISRLKLDRSLLKDITIRSEARVLVQTIISMANSLGFHSIAEGVETEAQLELLSDMGCDLVQGYLISRPIELDQLRKFISDENSRSGSNGKLTIAA